MTIYLHNIQMKKALFLLFVLTLFVNCAQRVVPIESVRVDSVYSARYERDTIYERDSVTIYAQSDTIYKDRYKYVYRDRVLRDTIYKSERDTVTNVVEVERNLTGMEELKINIGNGVLWAIPIIVALWLLYRKFIK